METDTLGIPLNVLPTDAYQLPNPQNPQFEQRKFQLGFRVRFYSPLRLVGVDSCRPGGMTDNNECRYSPNDFGCRADRRLTWMLNAC
ncbi:MAG: hypothetical protein AB7N65_23415 [Vicinamibacterales bacterium]